MVEVCVFEEHASVLPEWWGRGYRGRTVLYLDAHLDLQYVGPARLAPLQACTSREEVAGLEKEHHLLPDAGTAFSIEDFLYPASRLGIIEQLVWVVPPHVPAGYSASTLAQLTQTPGVTLEDLCLFRRQAQGHLSGRLLGLSLVICRLEEVERLSLPDDTLVDIDADYLVEVPEDRGWIEPRRVAETLRRAVPSPELVSLSRSVSSGFLPLRHRYLADLLSALWRGPRPRLERLERLHHLTGLHERGRSEEVRRGCRAGLRGSDRSAALLYLASRAEDDPRRAAALEDEAAALDAAYRPSALRDACGLTNRHRRVRLADVMRLEKRVEQEPDARRRALARLAVGGLHCLLGRTEAAERAYVAACDELGPNPPLALEIGKALAGSARPADAGPYLRTALHADKTRASAHVLLARLEGRTGDLDAARDHLERARRLTPADPEVADLLVRLHGRRGDGQARAAAAAERGRLRESLSRLAQRLDA